MTTFYWLNTWLGCMKSSNCCFKTKNTNTNQNNNKREKFMKTHLKGHCTSSWSQRVCGRSVFYVIGPIFWGLILTFVSCSCSDVIVFKTRDIVFHVFISWWRIINEWKWMNEWITLNFELLPASYCTRARDKQWRYPLKLLFVHDVTVTALACSESSRFHVQPQADYDHHNGTPFKLYV